MKIKCNECGAEMLDKSRGPYIHFVCPNCGNAIATYDYTKEDLIKLDDKEYYVKLIDNKASIETLKIISKITGNNFIKCKEMIEKNELILSGKAKDIIDNLRLLKENQIHFEINPDFVYKI